MKASKYNIYITLPHSILIFNTITERFFEVDNQRAPYIKQLINSPDCNYELYHAFIDKMKVDGFIIDSDSEDETKLRHKYIKQRRPETYRLMILPTYECNLRCWYCEQKRQNLWLGDFDYQKILDLWLNNAHRPDISQLHLSWFGGEPLMAFNQIEKLTSAAKSVADKVGKEFVCDITTNATLLTSDRIERLYRAGVSYYQITIDGSKIVHDKIKKLGSASAFVTIQRKASSHNICRQR